MPGCQPGGLSAFPKASPHLLDVRWHHAGRGVARSSASPRLPLGRRAEGAAQRQTHPERRGVPCNPGYSLILLPSTSDVFSAEVMNWSLCPQPALCAADPLLRGQLLRLAPA